MGDSLRSYIRMLKSHDIFKQCLSSRLMLLLKIKLSLGWKEACLITSCHLIVLGGFRGLRN